MTTDLLKLTARALAAADRSNEAERAGAVRESDMALDELQAACVALARATGYSWLDCRTAVLCGRGGADGVLEAMRVLAREREGLVAA